LAWYGKKLNPTQQMHAFANQRRVLQEKMNTRKTKPELVAFYDIRPGNSMGLFSKEKISKEKVKKNG